MALDWFKIASELKAISQAGIFYAKDDFERDRHKRLQQIAAHIFANYTTEDIDKALAILQQDTGHPTPKVDSRGVIFKDNKILLVKEIADGGWTLPGGWCEVGMTPSQNVVREVWEESGFESKALRILALYDRDNQGHTPPYPFSIYKIFFLCQITGGSPKPSNETSDVKFFAKNEIPNLSLGRTLPNQIQRFFEQYENPAIPPDFD